MPSRPPRKRVRKPRALDAGFCIAWVDDRDTIRFDMFEKQPTRREIRRLARWLERAAAWCEEGDK